MTNIEILNYFNNLISELKQTNSSNEKVKILEKYKDIDKNVFQTLMQYIYDYEKNYWITSTNVEKKKNEPHIEYDIDNSKTIFELLDRIIKRELTGFNAIHYINDLIRHFGEEYRELFYLIINKDMKVNTGVALINKAMPNTVKQFSVALAENNKDLEGTKHEINFDKKNYSVMRKLDGCRCIAMWNDSGFHFLSRQGKFNTLDTLIADVKELNIKNKWVLDGEVCIIDENGNENFQAIMKEITRKNHTIKNPIYVVFDLIPYEDFINGYGERIYKDRFEELKSLLSKHELKNIKLIQHQFSPTKDDYENWIKKAKDGRWEGLMLRDLNSKYEGKRTFNLIKCKFFSDAEYIVEDIEKGVKPFLENGLMEEKECVAALIISHKGSKVNVGSGLSNKQRLEWLKHPEQIIGKEITVQYFEETVDENGKPSLRFPTLKYVYDDKRKI